MTAFKLSGKQVSEPSLKQWDDTSQEKQPDPPSRSPEATSRAFSDWSTIESIVNKMLEILTRPDLVHELVFIAIHPCQLSHVIERIQYPVSELEGLAYISVEYSLQTMNVISHQYCLIGTGLERQQ